jgi:hypothetical protein
MNALSVITLFPSDKKERQSFLDVVLMELESGNNDPLEFEIGFKKIEALVDFVRKNEKYKDVIKRATPSEKKFSVRGQNVEVCSRKTAHYDNDVHWCQINAKQKAREAYLKALSADEYDEESGEILSAKPYYTESEYLKLI